MSTDDIRAIETRYAGCHFRSRLEARWAVFFDTANIRWEYEPEGFEDTRWSDENDCSPTRYLPDFYLPDTSTWVEVKGTNKAIREDIDRLERRHVVHPIIQHRKGLWLNFWSFTAGPKGGVCIDTGDGLQIKEIDIEEMYAPKDVGPERAYNLPGWGVAYIAARSARFEHGQSG